VEYGREIFAYQVETEAGERVVLSLMDAETTFARGLRAEAILGTVLEGGDPDTLTPADFQENPAFLRFLSRVIHEHVDQCPDILLEAEMQGSGHVYVLDLRTADPAGRVPAEDIIGAVKVEAGTTVAGSFQHNPRHRLLTHRGFFLLPEQLEAALRRRLRELAAE
jgi:hypothetical protein